MTIPFILHCLYNPVQSLDKPHICLIFPACCHKKESPKRRILFGDLCELKAHFYTHVMKLLSDIFRINISKLM